MSNGVFVMPSKMTKFFNLVKECTINIVHPNRVCWIHPLYKEITFNQYIRVFKLQS